MRVPIALLEHGSDVHGGIATAAIGDRSKWLIITMCFVLAPPIISPFRCSATITPAVRREPSMGSYVGAFGNVTLATAKQHLVAAGEIGAASKSSRISRACLE